jgi:hypothetical protein
MQEIASHGAGEKDGKNANRVHHTMQLLRSFPGGGFSVPCSNRQQPQGASPGTGVSTRRRR